MRMNAGTKFIKQIKKQAEDEEFQRRHVMNPETDFKRNRKLGFSDVIHYTIGNTRSPILLEAERFTKLIDADKISGAAICKARQKVRYTAFQELFEATAQAAPRTNCFHGYHVIAIDGMQGELPKTPELCEKYCSSPKMRTPVFHAVSAFDVLNEIFISSEFQFGTANERNIACQVIDSVMQNPVYANESQIWVFDRGFPSLLLLQKLMQHNLKYVMRVSRNFLKEIDDFRRSKYVDRQVHIAYSKKRMASNRVKSDGICEFDLRCVRIMLPSGEEEILITNLDRVDFPKRDIKKLYSLRWGIETSFNYLKNAVFVEEFTSRTENGLKQDYYVSLLVYNFASCIFGSMYHDIPKKENCNTKSTAEPQSD